jgi:peptidoglycan hydrolase-like protein with peptidoglycan-binding domain
MRIRLVLALDGQFGPGTKAAVTRFQQAYGLGADGIAGPATFAKIHQLQDDDCTPVGRGYFRRPSAFARSCAQPASTTPSAVTTR